MYIYTIYYSIYYVCYIILYHITSYIVLYYIILYMYMGLTQPGGTDRKFDIVRLKLFKLVVYSHSKTGFQA